MTLGSAAAKTVGIIVMIVGLIFAVIGVVYLQLNYNRLQQVPSWVIIFIVIGVIMLFFGALLSVAGALISARNHRKKMLEEEVKEEYLEASRTSC